MLNVPVLRSQRKRSHPPGILTCRQQKMTMTSPPDVSMLGTKALLMERRKITEELLEKNSPRPTADSRLIVLCLSSTQYPSIYRGD
jgi:hypothetical protein